ncbi:MAG: hypothetical protein R3B45_07295 [Bdellovibrionota bacterium]
MKQQALSKLEWQRLLTKLESFCHSEDGVRLCNTLKPALTRTQVEQRWAIVEPLKDLADQGYRAPIGALIPMQKVFRASSLGQILEGNELRDILSLLLSVEKVDRFLSDFSDRCSPLAKIKTQVYALPKIAATQSLEQFHPREIYLMTHRMPLLI